MRELDKTDPTDSLRHQGATYPPGLTKGAISGPQPTTEPTRSSSNFTLDAKGADSDVDDAEAMALLEDHQDAHLDILLRALDRQKEIGTRIHEELEAHINIIQETNDATENTYHSISRINHAQHKLYSSIDPIAGFWLILLLCLVLLALILL